MLQQATDLSPGLNLLTSMALSRDPRSSHVQRNCGAQVKANLLASILFESTHVFQWKLKRSQGPTPADSRRAACRRENRQKPFQTNTPNNCPGVIFVTIISTITNIPENPQTPSQNHLRYSDR